MGCPPPENPTPFSNCDAGDVVLGDIAGDICALSVEVNCANPNEPLATVIEASEKPTPSPSPSPSPRESPSPNPSPREGLTSYDFQHAAAPYTIPPWSEPPEHPFSLEVLKEGTIIEYLDLHPISNFPKRIGVIFFNERSAKGAYMFGRVDLCDFVLEHPTISRFHAVLQFRKDGAYIYDLGSTHGTFLNKRQVKKKVYTEIHVGDVLRFGHSSRLYILQGPSELMPPEGDLEKLRKDKIQTIIQDREASLLRAREEASLANGISWGMTEDIIEEDTENGADEITWQNYKGKLTERQEKTQSKIIKRMEKVSNMKKEIDAIRSKDIAQGGLTQGQQMQIARNEQRMSQILEELDNLEETLNDSIRESNVARAGRSVSGKRKGHIEEEEEGVLSDDDEFYDRTRKKPAAKQSNEHHTVETANSLLCKLEAINNEIEEKEKLLSKEQGILSSTKGKAIDGEDDLDAYMSGLSSQLVIDRTTQMKKALSDLQVELDRTKFLLKIADPTGEAARKREGSVTQAVLPQSNQSITIISKQDEIVENQVVVKPSKKSCLKTTFQSIPAEKLSENSEGTSEKKEEKAPAYTIAKPQWLGATKERPSEDDHILATNLDGHEPGDFVDYKDRKKFLVQMNNDDGDLEHAAPGLIIRKRKPLDANIGAEKASEMAPSLPAKSEAAAADAIALLLKHTRGYHAVDEATNEEQNVQIEGQPHKEIVEPRRVLGPARPNFLDRSPDYESWVPPEGQTGDGRTSLNDRLGY
ncbi:FHA domain-containing protein DDL [Apostasia shenzhenica]|uniref:FHA domain-containing protein DDL n=1 Tax=Apostasia shenzhenica TaxID=1088818 RepID=A0A2I0BHL0_9ASPA|nr:FHA domain-containing protein DDL [Apostasia shenzhenica]